MYRIIITDSKWSGKRCLYFLDTRWWWEEVDEDDDGQKMMKIRFYCTSSFFQLFLSFGGKLWKIWPNGKPHWREKGIVILLFLNGVNFSCFSVSWSCRLSFLRPLMRERCVAAAMKLRDVNELVLVFTTTVARNGIIILSISYCNYFVRNYRRTEEEWYLKHATEHASWFPFRSPHPPTPHSIVPFFVDNRLKQIHHLFTQPKFTLG